MSASRTASIADKDSFATPLGSASALEVRCNSDGKEEEGEEVVYRMYKRRWVGVLAICYIGALLLLMSAWIRYAGTADGLSSGGSYALILIGQILSGVVQPIFQVLIPGYSEKWFDLRQRTTATMLMSIGMSRSLHASSVKARLTADARPSEPRSA
ncbi:hypothetical protein EVJ58_g11035 [Rhodofomes roseus]|uniref:Uncharacterized protein n=1 Tax=Rhodofomes roseus TaxID=34475 RepID=A0A4Y9XKG3_9APHY|nr:hypothetical protein EVJ58_g11035 [Rhodofomes roseus]